MAYIVAPASDFSGGVLTTLANARISIASDVLGLTNGTSYRVTGYARVSPAFTPTGITQTPVNITGGNVDQFLIAPATDWDAADNLITTSRAILSTSLNLTGLSNIAYRAAPLSPPSALSFMPRGAASPFTDAMWTWSDTVSDAGDVIDWSIQQDPADGGYPITDIDMQLGTDDGLGGITEGAVTNVGLTGGQRTVLAETAAWARIRPVTEYGDNPWSPWKRAMPSKPAVGATTTVTVGATTYTLQGNVPYITHADGGVRIVSSGPVTFLDKAPATTGAGTTSLRHGSVLNPLRGRNGYDGRIGKRNYTDTITYPITINPGDGIMAVVSRTISNPTTTELRQGIPDSYAYIYVADTTADPATLTPTAIRWTGRNDFTSPYPAIDYLAKASLLPRSYGVPGWSYRTLASIQRRLRFNPAYAIETGNGGVDGYEGFYPYQWGGAAPYGEDQAASIAGFLCHLMAPVEQVSLENKAEILKWLDSYAVQTIPAFTNGRSELAADGAHRQWYHWIFALHYWMRGDLTSLQTCLTDWKGNIPQYFRFDQTMVDTWFQPYGNPDSDTSAYANPRVPVLGWRRRITSVDPVNKFVRFTFNAGGTGGKAGESVKTVYTKLKWVHEATGFQSLVVAEYGRSGDWADGDTVRVTLQDWPTTDPAVGDVMYFVPEFPLTLDMPAWRIEDGSYNNFFNPSVDMNYRKQQKVWGCMFLFRAMGEFRPDWKVIWDYNVLAAGTGWPSAINDYGDNPDGPGLSALPSGSLQEAVWTAYSADLIAVPQPYLGDVPLSPYYPDVPAVDVTAASGSLMFPEGNNGSGAATLTQYKGALYQSDAGFTMVSSSTAQATFAIVRLPRDKRYTPNNLGIVGTGGTGGATWWLRLDGGANGTTGWRNKFEFSQFGTSGSRANLFSAEWTEDAALVVAWCNGTSLWGVDWYSLNDGTRFSGPTSTITTGGIGDLTGSQFNIGRNGTGTTYTSNGSGEAWGGEIEAIGLVRGANAIDMAKWTNIALGSPVSAEMGFANLRWYRQLDGTSATYGPVAGETNDPTTAAMVPFAGGTGIPPAWVRPGSHIRRQGLSSYLTIDGISDGWVYGLMAGETEKAVPFSGKAAGYSGSVEIQVYDRDTGTVVRDWTVCGTISAGVWSGTVTLPKTALRSNGDGWWGCRARIASNPTVIFDRKTAFGVGWKVLFVGQSQLSISFTNGASLSLDAPMTGSYVESDDREIGTWREPTMGRIGMTVLDRGARTFLNQWRKFDASTPVMIIRDSINGTAMLDLMQNTSSRIWDSFVRKIAKYGNDISVVVHNWGTNESNLGSTGFKTRLDGYFFNTGADATGRSLSTALQPGFKVAISPLTRYGDATSHDTPRVAEVQWANANGSTVGPPTSDFMIATDQGPHPETSSILGSNLMISRMTLAALKALGLATFSNPYFSGATISADRTQITISVALPNGGSLFCPGTIRSLSIGGSTSGFTASVVGNTIVATKSSGAWGANVSVSYLQNGETRARNLALSVEQAIIDGFLYETWSPDIIGRGLPVLGSLSGGQWVPTWSTTIP